MTFPSGPAFSLTRKAISPVPVPISMHFFPLMSPASFIMYLCQPWIIRRDIISFISS